MHLAQPARATRRAVLVLALAGAVLPVAGPVPGPVPASAAAAGEPELPEARKILENAVSAMGGVEAIDRIATLRVKADMSAMGLTMGMEASWSKAGARLIRQSMPEGIVPGGGPAEIIFGSDGTIHWTRDPAGKYALVGEEEMEELEQQALLHLRLLRMDKTAEEDFKSCQTTATADFNGRSCYKVHIVPKDDETSQGNLFFDVETQLPVGFEMIEQEGPMGGAAMATATLAEWKEIQGVQFFQKVLMNLQMEGMQQQFEMSYKQIEVNALDPEVFAVPEEVKKLAATQMPPARPKEDGGG